MSQRLINFYYDVTLLLLSTITSTVMTKRLTEKWRFDGTPMAIEFFLSQRIFKYITRILYSETTVRMIRVFYYGLQLYLHKRFIRGSLQHQLFQYFELGRHQ